MREILFRGKRIDNGEWGYGQFVRNYLTKDDYCIVDFGNLQTSMHGAVQIIPETVGQFTGLTDKNGKKIFEGDIVKVTDSPFGYSYIGVTCFHEGSFCIQYTYWNKKRFHRIGQTDKWQDMGARGTVTYKYEVVGNIHDNPELIGRTDNA